MSKCELEVVTFDVSTCLSPPPPPSCPNASQRWSISAFQHASHHHHLPRVQTRAGGGLFRCFDVNPTTATSLASKRELEVVFSAFRHASHHHHLPRVQMQAGGGHFLCFDAAPTTTTSLASKCEPEVVLFSGFKASAAAATSSPPPNRQRQKWIGGGEADERNVGSG
jgi:hypothetical protein